MILQRALLIALIFAIGNCFSFLPSKSLFFKNVQRQQEEPLLEFAKTLSKCSKIHTSKTSTLNRYGKRDTTYQFKASVAVDGEESSSKTPDVPLWKLVEPQRRNLLVSVFFGLLGSFVSVLFPLAFGQVLSALLNPVLNMKQLYKALGVMSVLYVLEPIITYVYVRQMTFVNDGIITKLKLDAFQSILSQNMSFFDEKGVGEIVGTITTDIKSVKEILAGNLSKDRGLRALTEVMIGAVILAKLNWQLGLVFSSIIPVAATLCAQFRKLFFLIALAEIKSLGNESKQTNEIIRNIREVRSFGTEDREYNRFQSKVLETASSGIAVGKGAGKLEAFNRAAIYISILSVIFTGAKMVSRGIISAAFLIPFVGFCFSMNFAIQGINLSYTDFKRGYASLQRIYGILSLQKPAASLGNKIIPQEDLKGDIELQNVQFEYPTRPDVKVFENLNLQLKAGTVTALVGESGAGKSTISALLSGFYEPSGGSIKLDGTDLSELDKAWKTQQIAMVGQQPALFSGTVAENIAYGAGLLGQEYSQGELNGATMDQIIEAAQQANAHNFISKFPEGYDTLVGEGGIQLSGGQKQRVAIARAIMKKSKILVLDEATSALDAESEALVQDALENLMKGKTVLVIAHRLSTVVNADKICVIKDGIVFEEGTHEELMGKNGAYSKLMKTQTQGVTQFIPETKGILSTVS
mmetsp:Transcript_10876/g.14147  ORF Transcript_10876/g.14147 Transcript_10876/m.14147 type:complete len:694 (-) Transcript_10876:97-2178(-)|eukprot:CAMPEP_0117767256 /NCGR_PEP_ID=MMETSP0947-20121206/21492_1 /TAXON_ID=44440 /ORGANISM="Chattonella subsalsa, Strain CCMP2191" /LENGTH=693 /DNA_ID=CAMNT_0005590853 /DNA_START=82 /DNA_END=2163 /DNA_ORIENTATION=-